MKAIIAEIDKKHMIVITDKGDFVKVKRQMSAAIGDEIELKQRRIYPISKRLAGLAACFMACIFLSTGVYAYCTPYSYVSVDINPSLSLALNRFERVISVNPLTEDAVDLIKDAKSLKNRNIDAALSEIIKTASDKGYINEEAEDEIVVIVSAKNPKQEKKLEETVAKTAEKELSKVNKAGGVTVEKTNVENHKTAISQKVSPGRTVLEESLKKVMPEIKDEVVKDMSVKEVANLIREKRKEAEKAEKAAKEAEDAKKAAEAKGYEVLGGLLDTFITAYNEYSNNNLTPKYRAIINLIPKRFFFGENQNTELYQRLLRVIDFISGMTDSYAVSIFRKIKGISLPGGRVTE